MTHVRSILYAVIDIIWNRNDRTDLLYVNISEFTLVSRHHCVRQSVHTPVLRLFALSSLARASAAIKLLSPVEELCQLIC